MPALSLMGRSHVTGLQKVQRQSVLRLGVVGRSFRYSDQTLLIHPVLLTHRLPESFANERVKLQATLT